MIEKGVQEVYTSDRFKEYLTSLSKFHNYSLNNTMLILAQYPEASLVAGFNSWSKNFKRHVLKGEKAIKILAPYQVKYKAEVETQDENGNQVTEEKEYQTIKFRIVNVFDISQTDGEPLPELVHDLKGTSESSKFLISSIHEICEIEIIYSNPFEDKVLRDGAKGYYSFTDDKIVINDELDDIQKAKTLTHEYAHSILHKERNKSQSQREIEAESLAFVICNHFGIDTSEYSFSYVASYAKNNEEFLKETLLNIQSNAHEMITRIEPIYERNMMMNNEKTYDIDLKDINSIEDKYLTPDELEYISKGLVEDVMHDVSAMPVYDYLRSKDNQPELGKETIENDLVAIVDTYKDKHPVAVYLYNNNDYFKEEFNETIFLRCYLDIYNPSQDRPFLEDSIQRENYIKFKEFGSAILNGDANYMKLQSSSAFMDLNIDCLSENSFALSHYYELNGDMMADPDMEIIFDKENQLLNPQTYQQDDMNMYRDIKERPEIGDELNPFLNQWLKNIKDNNYRIVEIQGESFDISFNDKGEITDSNGNHDVINKYQDNHFNIGNKTKVKGQER